MNPFHHFAVASLLLALFAFVAYRLVAAVYDRRDSCGRPRRTFRRIGFASFFIACILLPLGLVTVLCIFIPTKVSAQPYYTNTVTGNPGVPEYGDTLITRPQITQVLTNQAKAGIYTGTGITVANGTVTNSFNHTYLSPPTVVVTQTGTVPAGTNLVQSITTTNFVYVAGAPNITNNWQSIGAP